MKNTVNGIRFFVLGLSSFLAMSLAFSGSLSARTGVASKNPLAKILAGPNGLPGGLDIELDGETFRNVVEAALEGVPELPPSQNPSDDDLVRSQALDQIIHIILPQVRKVHLKGSETALSISIDMAKPITAELVDPNQAKWFQLYAVSIPEHVQMQLAYREPSLVLEPVGPVQDFVTLRVRIPVFSDKVYIHSVALNPLESQIEAKAGVAWDVVRLRSSFSLVKKKKLEDELNRNPVEEIAILLRPFLLPFLGAVWEQER